MATSLDPRVAEALRSERAVVWGVCYRMTGSASTADDLTQETLLRALERPPADLDAPLRPWLVRVAMNLARDALRKRRREAYVGPWLPEPVPTAELDALERRQVVEYGLLLAMERLTAHQRAVLVLREALELGEQETAEALGSTVGSVKVALHRARKVLGEIAETSEPSAELKARHAERLTALMTALGAGDVETARALLSDDVVVLQDGAGRVRAARVPVRGAEKAVVFMANLARITPPPLAVEWIELNHLPALDLRLPPREPPLADRILMRIDLNAEGLIAGLHNLVAPEKLARLDARLRG